MTASPMQNGKNICGPAGGDIKGKYNLKTSVAGRTGGKRAGLANATSSMTRSVRYTSKGRSK